MSASTADFITPKYGRHTYFASAKVPAPSDDDDASNKKYVDDAGGTSVNFTTAWSGAITLGSAVYGKITKNSSGIVTFAWYALGGAVVASVASITSSAGAVLGPYRPLSDVYGFCWVYDTAGTPFKKLGIFRVTTDGTVIITKSDESNFTSGWQARVEDGGVSYPV